MKLTTTAELFWKHRVAIAEWLLNNRISVELYLWPSSQKVRLLFNNTQDAARLFEEFEGL
ncbi:hypothetical protein ACAX43_12490 [Paraburkholderia sp. IW21]|uniref:hypothetical protein n=1 Tax=Paraburkholderia sp. IW21 TaxID=3242488 RepID=UPI00352277AB